MWLVLRIFLATCDWFCRISWLGVMGFLETPSQVAKKKIGRDSQSQFGSKFQAETLMGFLETPSQFPCFRVGGSWGAANIQLFHMIASFNFIDFVMGFLETPSLWQVNFRCQNVIGFSVWIIISDFSWLQHWPEASWCWSDDRHEVCGAVWLEPVELHPWGWKSLNKLWSELLLFTQHKI